MPKDGCFREKHLTLPLFWFEQKSKDAWSTYVPWRESVHPSQQMHLATSRGEKLRRLENSVTLFPHTSWCCTLRNPYSESGRLITLPVRHSVSSSVQQLSPWPGNTGISQVVCKPEGELHSASKQWQTFYVDSGRGCKGSLTWVYCICTPSSPYYWRHVHFTLEGIVL